MFQIKDIVKGVETYVMVPYVENVFQNKKVIVVCFQE